ncbi:FtsX-like permease family protein [Gemella sp. zg-1178]|uniref:FtsX-like permease family protein n=1 Tax=Gemella sp. zg-1178 TaxID=2840372 RepID=UPI001C04F8A1|nr:ABC transporter permease [Gemella sp. zg-1178]MBU0279049.1 ABC transporter permease [Gemella sp. zg-1178]
MTKLFYGKLAFNNIKNNKSLTLPYILSSMFMVTLFYIITSLRNNENIAKLRGASATKQLLTFGQVIVAIFITVFLFYTYSFLIKKRTKEMGLYSVLGMTKNQIIRVISLETLYTGFISTFFGLTLGIILDKLAYLSFLKLLGEEVKLGFNFSIKAISIIILLFSIIYLLIILKAIIKIKRINIIGLLKDNQRAEKEPKGRIILSLIALGLIGYGYYSAVTIETPLKALSVFFYAVLAVIIGTYLLFTSFSIFTLKILKNNKNYYYKTKNFISISNLLFRIKRNALGLANICILSTMVLVTLGSTSSLYFGTKDLINTSYPRDIMVEISTNSKANKNQLTKEIEKIVAENKEIKKDQLDYTYMAIAGAKTKEGIEFKEANYSDLSKALLTIYITLEDYNKTNNTNISLADDEILFEDPRNKEEKSTFRANTIDFKVKARADKTIQAAKALANVTDTYYIVVKDRQVLEKIKQEAINKLGEEYASRLTYNNLYAFNIENKNNSEKLATALGQISKQVNRKEFKFVEDVGDNFQFIDIVNKETASKDIKGFVSSFYFIGIIISAIFIISQVVIMYYKQISEGYDDKDKFKIMQQVGLEEKEIKSSIKGQVLLIFFAPLLVAASHVIFVYPFIEKLLKLFSLTNTKIFLYAMGTTFIIFSVFYIIIYTVTSRTYYNIIKEK